MPDPQTPTTIIWAVHQKGMNHDHSGGWRGVLVGHWNNLDLIAVKKPGAQKPPPQVMGYVYDPQMNGQEIVLTEIEGRLLECKLTSKKFDSWRTRQGPPKYDGTKISIMIDDQARHGDRPEYSKGDLAFPVGFATWTIDTNDWPSKGSDKVSPMLMRPIWRDNTSPLWGEWTDPSGVQCQLLSMYFITETGFKGITQVRPHYKFNHPPPPVRINLGIGNTTVSSKMMAPLGKSANEGTQGDDDDNGDDVSPPTHVVEPEEPKTIDSALFDGDTLAEVEKEMDAAPDGEVDKVDKIVVQDEGGETLKL